MNTETFAWIVYSILIGFGFLLVYISIKNKP